MESGVNGVATTHNAWKRQNYSTNNSDHRGNNNFNKNIFNLYQEWKSAISLFLILAINLNNKL